MTSGTWIFSLYPSGMGPTTTMIDLAELVDVRIIELRGEN